jgi:RNA polymerase sigma factor (sigma-70 family)
VTDVPGGTILDHLYRAAGAAALAGRTDAELLRHVLAGPGAAAEAEFTVLVHRHGPLVYRTCRAALRDTHDAEDAFQATFLVLARKARSLRVRGDLGPWLYEVARRVTAHARAAAARRRKHEQQAAAVRAGSVSDGTTSDSEIASLVHDAVGRLPQRFRAAVVLCDLEGLSYREAAGRLGWTLPTVRNRLARGRQRLRTALLRAGLAPESAALATATAPTLPRALAIATSRAAAQVATGSAGGVPESVLLLVNGGLHAMLIAKLKTAGLSILAAAVLVAGAYRLGAQGPGAPRGANATPLHIAATAPAQADPPAAEPRKGAAAIVAKLNQRVNIEKEVDNTPLRDVLSFLSDKYDVTFVVNVVAFDRDNANKHVEDNPVRLPKMPGVTLRTILQHLLAQVQGTVLVRNDHFEVVTHNQALVEVFGPLPNWVVEHRLEQPIVNVVCDGSPLERALAEIAEQSGRNVVLDSRITDRDKLAVTAKLLNTPIDTAVRVLAEMVSLKSVQLDNVFLVTTREHAAELQAEEAKHAEGRREELREIEQKQRELKRERPPDKPNAAAPRKT